VDIINSRLARVTSAAGATSVAGIDADMVTPSHDVRFFINDSGGTLKTWNGPAADTSPDHIGILTYPGPSLEPYATWDGVRYGFGSTITDSRAPTGIELGGSNGNSSTAVHGGIMMWSRALSLAEHAALNEDPFQMLVW
jgi:hypothetical protein